DERDRNAVLENRPPPGLRALVDADVPAKLTAPFLEKDGTLGRIVLVTPRSGHTAWDGHFLLQFANAVESTPLPDGSVVRAAGRPLIFADILRSVVADGPRAVALSLFGVVLLVAVTIRRLRPVLIVLGTLVGGLGIMLGIAAVSGIR